MDGIALRAHAKFLVANPHQRTDVATLQLIGAHHVALHFHDFFLAERNVHTQNLRAVEQALGVFF